MNSLKAILRLLGRGLMWVLFAYWVILISYSIMHLITGGPSGVVVWYRHISRAPLQWNWGAFLAGQMFILAVTVVLFIFERRNPVEHR
jgi:hypothetical protein